MKFYRYSLLLLPLLSTITPIVAEEMSPIIVTATRTAQTADETLESVDVITRNEIESSQTSNVMDLLKRTVVGIDVSRSGGIGSNTSIYIRGTNSNHILILVDGVRASSATTGTFNWNSIPTNQIERIEIVRGPHSTLYGADAVGGVIQIFTRKQKTPTISAGIGSYNSSELSAATGGEVNGSKFQIAVSQQKSDGFSNTNSTSSSYNADNDGYKNSTISGGIDIPLNSQAEISLSLLHADGYSEYDSGATEAYNDTINQSANLKLNWDTSETWQQQFSTGYTLDSIIDTSSTSSEITTRRQQFDWQNNLYISDQSLLTLGLEQVRENSENVGTFNESVNNLALFGQLQWEMENFDLLIGGRNDRHSEYGSKSTGRIAIGKKFGDLRAFLNYGTAFKAPTMNNLYHPGYGGWYAGNTALKPETSHSTEIGLTTPIGDNQTLRSSLYNTEVEDLIDYSGTNNQAINISRVKIKGLEIEYTHKIATWKINGGLTLQSAKDATSGDKLLRRAETKFIFGANGPITSKTDIGLELSYVGTRMDYSSKLDAYSLINITGRHQLSPSLSITARLENLLNEDYMLAEGYNTPGYSAYATINYRI